PTAARGAMRERWCAIEATLRAENFAFDFVFTERPWHAVELTRAALDAGCDLIVAVGGDGTLNEVVNGMFTADGTPINPNAALGVITSGTGGDFARTAGIPRDPTAAARQLAHATQTRAIDLGEMIFTRAGKETRRFFANIAGIGFDAEVIERTESGGKRGGGTIPYYSALVTTIWKYRNKQVVVQMDDQRVEGKMNAVVVCNGKFFGGGMQISPNSNLADGILDVIILGDLGRFEVVMNTPRLYNGTILEHPKVTTYRARTIVVEPAQRMLIEADGEFIGPGPATFRVCRGALNLFA
ncbi:MAG: diacylglycerol kinase family lipid kinase, partial [Anaerolineales bacterium]|nr:diacylglycerol kinase family lipid kinase [Anaerolineales bacterium]